MGTFRPASRSNSKPLIGLYAESGCGKTYSSLVLARGFVGPNGKIGMIETEGGRGEANVGREPIGDYLVRPITTNFSPKAFGQAIADGEAEKLDALIIDSASHEWEGVGGVLSMADANQKAGKTAMLVWQGPKDEHKREFVLRMLQTPIPLVIVCMRANYPMEQVGKNWQRSTVLDPVQNDRFLYEMFVHGWIDHAHKFHGTKYTLPELAQVIRDGEPISIESGKRLAEWAKGSGAASFVPPKREEAPAEQKVDDFGTVDSDTLAVEAERCDVAAAQGWAALKAVWEGMPKDVQDVLRPRLDAWKETARAAKKTEAA